MIGRLTSFFLFLPWFCACAEDIAFFETKIRPLLIENCYDCHSVEAGKQKGGLLLDSKWGWETGGDSGPAIVPGDVEKSLVIDAVRRTELRMDAMPPKSVLPADQVALLEQWIAMGAPDPRPKIEAEGSLVEEFDLQKRHAEHWCWRPLASPVIPDGANPIDHLIGQKLTAAGLRPAQPADPRTLTRRLYFDLIGLPPGPEDLSRFNVESSTFDVQPVIDHLLASPRFGEKWARHWMDLVRYAESCGHEFDYPLPHAHEYRDYLIRAFNADLPYDQFVTEHLAGDLLTEPRRHPEEGYNESVIGTGFWHLHEATHAPTDVQGDEADHLDNQLDVFGKAFQSLTVACARCHDHKFDAISTADYYALTAYIRNGCRQEHPLDPGGVHAATAARQTSLREEGAKLLRATDAPYRPGPYFLAAAALIRAEKAKPQTADPWAGHVFEDFENGYARWTIEGEAFGEAPAAGAFSEKQKLSGFRGKGLINTRKGNGDLQGSATSQPFTIEKPYINFLVGGGKHKETRAELLIEGKAVRTARGKNRDQLDPVTWKVDGFLGQTARIRLIDQQRGAWGHLDLDHIVFSDASTSGERVLLPPAAADIATAATAAGLDPAKLKAWCRILGSPGPKLSEPDGFLARWIEDPATIERVRDKARGTAAAIAAYEAESERFANFPGETLPPGWNASGTAFLPTGSQPGLRFDPSAPFATPGVVDSGALGNRHVGTLRSPTFEIGTKEIHVRLRSEKTMARVVIDDHHMTVFHKLLFNGTICDEKHASTNTRGEFRWLRFSGNLDKYVGHRAFLEFVDSGDGAVAIAEIRFADRTPPPAGTHPLIRQILGTGTSIETDAQMAEALDSVWGPVLSGLNASNTGPDEAALLNWLCQRGLLIPADLATALDPLLASGRELNQALPEPRFAVAMAQGTRQNARVYIRGSHTNLGEEVPPRFLEALGGEEGDRLALARQITRPDNPLTARSIVNRLWHHLFGRGLVPTVDDFGPMGQAPSHPELLDWLAADFMAHGWSIKHTLETIAQSATYQQASLPHPDLDPGLIATADPTNALLYRAHVRRLQAEAIRDAILAVTGTLNTEAFGPSVPTHRTAFMTGRGARGSGPLDGNGRRSVYLSIYRNFLNPFLLTFDMPGPFGPKGRRSTSNVPAQALALMNDPFVIGQTKKWGEAVARSGGSIEARIAAMTERALGRPPAPEELSQLQQFLEEQLAAYGGAEPQAWADLAHVLVNRKDFSFVQ